MAKGDKEVIFTDDFSVHKKDAKVTLSRDLTNLVVSSGVAKLVEAKKTSKPKSKNTKK